MEILNLYKCFFKMLFLATVLFSCTNFTFAQSVLPKRTLSQPSADAQPKVQPLTVTARQAIYFGAFTVGSRGGTIKVGWDGSRSCTGDIVLLSTGQPAQPAIFELRICGSHKVIITYPSYTILTCNNGTSLTLDIGPTEKGISGTIFTTNSDCNSITQLRVGGTLHIPGYAVSCDYTGGFDITFDQE